MFALPINEKLATKAITALVVLIIFVIVVLLLVKKAKDIKSGLQSKSLVKDADLAITQNQVTYTNPDFSSFADKLFTAMKGAGTDFKAIKEVLQKLRTKNDWLKLVSTFGVRETKAFGGLYSFKGNLVEWLTDELSANERNEINQLLARINVSI